MTFMMTCFDRLPHSHDDYQSSEYVHFELSDPALSRIAKRVIWHACRMLNLGLENPRNFIAGSWQMNGLAEGFRVAQDEENRLLDPWGVKRDENHPWKRPLPAYSLYGAKIADTCQSMMTYFRGASFSGDPREVIDFVSGYNDPDRVMIHHFISRRADYLSDLEMALLPHDRLDPVDARAISSFFGRPACV